MACDPETLLANAKDFIGLSSKTRKAMMVRLLCAAVDGESMACDPETLQEEAKCIECAMTEPQMEAVIVSLLCQLVGDLSP